MIARLVGFLAEVLLGLLIAGVVVGAVIPFVHGAVGPVNAAFISIAIVVGAIVAGELFRRKKPTLP